MKMLTGKDVRDATDYVNAGSDYWAVVAERLNEKLRADEKLGLGSGALREALEQIASITCYCHDSTDANWHGKRCPKGIALAALSLSSPVEPDVDAEAESIRGYFTLSAESIPILKRCLGRVFEAGMRMPTPQASSEVREAGDTLWQRCLSLVERCREKTPDKWDFAHGLAEICKEYAALAPSRQGAGDNPDHYGLDRPRQGAGGCRNFACPGRAKS